LAVFPLYAEVMLDTALDRSQAPKPLLLILRNTILGPQFRTYDIQLAGITSTVRAGHVSSDALRRSWMLLSYSLRRREMTREKCSDDERLIFAKGSRIKVINNCDHYANFSQRWTWVLGINVVINLPLFINPKFQPEAKDFTCKTPGPLNVPSKVEQFQHMLKRCITLASNAFAGGTSEIRRRRQAHYSRRSNMTCRRHLRISGILAPSERIFSGDRGDSAWKSGICFRLRLGKRKNEWVDGKMLKSTKES